MSIEPRPDFLKLAEQCGARLTGKPDGSEPIEVVFSIQAWRAFDKATAPAQEPCGYMLFQPDGEAVAFSPKSFPIKGLDWRPVYRHVTAPPAPEAVPPKHGCYNRVAKPTYLGQDGWRMVHLVNKSTRLPKLVVIDNKMSQECQYSIATKNDPQCAGCNHLNPRSLP